MVGAANRSPTERSTPKASSIRASARMASREWPPRAKKSSWTPTSGSFSTSRQIAASRSSRGVRGGSTARPERRPDGRRSGDSGGSSAAAAASRWPAAMRSASPATVGASNRSVIEISRPISSWICASTRMASREWPPRVKKSSWTPISDFSSTPRQIAASRSSRRERGGVEPAGPATSSGSRAASARRSILPLGLSGSSARAIRRAGIMCSGRSSRSRSSRSSGSPSPQRGTA